MPDPMRSPGVRFPPPFLFATGFLAGWGLHRWVVPLPLAGGDGWPALPLAGGLLLAAGLALMLWGLVTFHRARTAVLPHRPATRLVREGPYRFSRNPMYTGLTLAYLGLAFLANSGWPILLLPLVVATLLHLVIRREERYLAQAFGDEYAAYRRGVRRWL